MKSVKNKNYSSYFLLKGDCGGFLIKDKTKAFTLVELIVVITILAILGTIAFISLQGYSANSRDSVRISDTGNMKKALELFYLNAGKYPLPDNYGTLTFSGSDLFYQGTFGQNVLQSVSRNMSEIPTDPLTQLEYIYSISNTKNELEILILLEGNDYVYNSISPLSREIVTFSQTNAVGTDVVVRITGNYNGLFVKTSTHIVPLPSIINTEVDSFTVIELTQSKIESMVTNLGENIPDYGNVISNTGALVDLTLAVWTGTLDNDSINEDKLAVFTAIQTAYTGSSLVNDGIIADVLSKTTVEEQVAITNIVVLNNAVTTVTTSSFTCGDNVTAIGGETYTTIIGADGNCWTSQNMRHGTMLSGVDPSDNNIIEKWCYNDIESNCDSYGGLYSWSEAMGFDDTCNTIDCSGAEDITKSVCGALGTGWGLPSDTQLQVLRSAGVTGWTGNKLSDIISLLAGQFINSNDEKIFFNIDSEAYWWSSTHAWAIGLTKWDDSVSYNDYKYYKSDGYSIVCIKN